MRHSRGPKFSFSPLKIHVFSRKWDTLCATRADPNLTFRELKSVFKIQHSTLYAPHAQTRFFHFTPKDHVFGHKLDTYAPLARTQIWSFVLKNPCLRSKFRHFIRHSCGPDFSVSPIEIHVFGQKLDTLSATRVDSKLAFRALKSVFKVKK